MLGKNNLLMISLILHKMVLESPLQPTESDSSVSEGEIESIYFLSCFCRLNKFQ